MSKPETKPSEGRMITFQLELRVPRGSVLVGGYSPVPVGIDSAHARRKFEKEERAIIPSTALRGALREALEAILRGAGKPVCARGFGLQAHEDRPDPEAEAQASGVEPGPCKVDGGEPCAACRIFGTPSPFIEAPIGKLVLSDAVADTADGFTVRHGVGIERSQRSAREKILFDAHVPQSTADLRFFAHGRLLDKSLLPYLEAAIRATTHIGGRRSRGFGRVDLTLHPQESNPPKSPEIEDSTVYLRVRLKSPAMIGSYQVHPNLRVTRKDVPGSALRGAVGFALAEASEGSEDASFQELVDENKGARFGFLYPEASDVPKVIQGRAGPVGRPWPITSRTCKAQGLDHGLFDLLLPQLIVRLLFANLEEGGLAQVGRWSEGQCPHPGCNAPLQAPPNYPLHPGKVETRLITRVSLDRESGTARSGALFSHELLEGGLCLSGRISHIPPGSRERLQEALGAPLSLGRGRSMGWGAIEILRIDKPENNNLGARRQMFLGILAGLLEQVGLEPKRAERIVPITLLSPMIPSEGEKVGPEVSDQPEEAFGSKTVQAALPGAKVVLALRRFTQVGHWDNRGGRGLTVEQAVEGGGVFVVELPEDSRAKEILNKMKALEEGGIGRWRHLGYGAIRTFDSLHSVEPIGSTKEEDSHA